MGAERAGGGGGGAEVAAAGAGAGAVMIESSRRTRMDFSSRNRAELHARGPAERKRLASGKFGERHLSAGKIEDRAAGLDRS